MRIALHTGKGGVGKTTISAATAVAAADAGHRTLLLSTDPAHSVADVLGAPVGADPTAVDGVPGLWAAQLDVRGRFEQAWSGLRDYLVTVLAARGVSSIQAEELTVLPGAEEVIALLELHSHACSGRFDVIVVDCAPSGETVRLLALPETAAFYADRLLRTPARLLRGLASLIPKTGGGPDTAVRDAVGDLLARLQQVRALLTDPAVSAIRMVMTPERVVVAEARRLWTALALHGYAVDRVVVNRVLPPELAQGYLAGWRSAQQRALAEARESFDVPVRELTHAAAEPVGPNALRALAFELFEGIDPLFGDAAPEVALQTGERDGVYLLRIPLPLAPQGEIELSRSDDDLVLTLGPLRRRLALPSLLRRCAAVGAKFDGDVLEVEFVPGPALWPAALTGTEAAPVGAGSR